MTSNKTIIVLAALWLGGTAAAAAQDQKKTTIHVVFQGYYERVRPGYAAGTTTEKFDLVLSGGNSIEQTFNGSNALASKTFVLDRRSAAAGGASRVHTGWWASKTCRKA